MAIRPRRVRGGARRRCLHSSTIAPLIGGANDANARMAGREALAAGQKRRRVLQRAGHAETTPPMVLTLTVSDVRDHHL
jgi:hypothetical protein